MKPLENITEVAGKSRGFVKEFKEFAMKGNVMDLAIGVVIGSAFGKIVSSLVADVIMPFIGLLSPRANFSTWKVVVRESTLGDPAVILNIGLFIQSVLDFVIIAFAIFMMIKVINRAKRKNEVKGETPTTSSDEVVLLTEIRDLLKK